MGCHWLWSYSVKTQMWLQSNQTGVLGLQGPSRVTLGRSHNLCLPAHMLIASGMITMEWNVLSRILDTSLFSFPIKSLLEFDNITGQEHRCSSIDLEEAQIHSCSSNRRTWRHLLLSLQMVRPFPSAEGQWRQGHASQF